MPDIIISHVLSSRFSSVQSFFSALKVYILGTNSGLRMADLKLWLVATLYNMKRLCQVRRSLSPTSTASQYDPRRPYFVGCPAYLHLQYMVSLCLSRKPRQLQSPRWCHQLGYTSPFPPRQLDTRPISQLFHGLAPGRAVATPPPASADEPLRQFLMEMMLLVRRKDGLLLPPPQSSPNSYQSIMRR